MTAPQVSTKKIASPQIYEKLEALRKAASSVILDKNREIELALCCLISGGHLLIEDIPGVGKTTLVKTLSKLLALETSRIQFTNDLLPADILGSSIYDSDRKGFIFHRGPLFAPLVLADELNRATPKTQSACLQAMEERRVTVDGTTYELPLPFFMIATQNPRQQIGTYPLPESQLDRFLMRISLGYPSREAEKQLLVGESRLSLVDDLKPVAAPADLLQMQMAARSVHASDSIISYVQDIIDKTRNGAVKNSSPMASKFAMQGLSPRGALGFISAARSWAFMQGRSMILPEDVQAVAIPVMSHRLNPVDDLSGDTGARWAEDILASVRVE
jgi:MoxR-like ATPase